MSRGFLSIVVGLSAALCFSVAGVLVKPLLEAGWSPAAAVLGRVIVCATILILPGLFALRFDLRPLLKSPGTILLYGAIAVAGTQLAYYAAIARIPVSIALLIQYLAPLLLICLAWARTRRRPQIIVLIGTAVAICGLVLVIGPNLSGLDALGLAFAAIGTLGLASYYLLGARVTDDLPPVTLVASGFVIAAIIVFISGVIGLTPLHARFDLIPTGSTEVPWYLLLGTVGVTTALAFVMGVVSIRRLGTRLASFLGLSEVFFAATISWLLNGESLNLSQVAGGGLIVLGIVCVRLERPTQDYVSTDTGSTVIGAEALPLSTASIPVTRPTSTRARRCAWSVRTTASATTSSRARN